MMIWSTIDPCPTFWAKILFWCFVDRYDEFWCDSFTKSYQKSEIFLMAKFESVWRALGWLNDVKTLGLRHTNLTTRTENFETRKLLFCQNEGIRSNFINEKMKIETKLIKNQLNSIISQQICTRTFFQISSPKIIKIHIFEIQQNRSKTNQKH